MERKGFYEKYIKRPQDIVLSLVFIVLLSPVLIIIYFLVLMNLGKPAIFKQIRTGKDLKPFVIYKFRTMGNGVDANTNKTKLSCFGKKLRSSSLDELPQLFNILKGDMSFIGPRPQLHEFLPLYNEKQLRRHEVRPGLSGLAQVSGRNNITWTKRFELDVHYVDNISFLGDLKLMFMTLYKVLIKEGIENDDNITMDKFDGTN